MLLSDVQFEKAEEPMLVTESGIITLSKVSTPAKKLSGMTVILFGKTTLFAPCNTQSTLE